MKLLKYIFIILISYACKGQTEPTVFYNESGEKITKKQFLDYKNKTENMGLYYNNDSIQYAILLTQKKFGKLDENTFTRLKDYLSTLSGSKIDASKNIVINYLNKYPEKAENKTTRTGWNVLDKDYLKKLHRIADINQYWIHSPESDNLEYYHQDRINWLADKDLFFKTTFFPYDVRYGNYILIKPNGNYYYHLSEHSKYTIWDTAKQFFK